MNDPNQLNITWQQQPVATITTPDGTTLTAPLTPAQTAAAIKRLATYLATWHRRDVDLTDVDHETDPTWQPPHEHTE